MAFDALVYLIAVIVVCTLLFGMVFFVTFHYISYLIDLLFI